MKLFEKLKHEFFLVLPPTLFFFISFTLLVVSKRLVMREYGLHLMGFSVAIIGALVVAKVILILDHLSFIDKFPDKPLICNIVWKSSLYFIATFFARYLEHIIPLWHEHRDFMLGNQRLLAEVSWPQFVLTQMWLAVLILVYCTLSELVRAFGKKEIMRLFFGSKQNQ